MNAPRPRGRAGAGALIALAIVVLALALENVTPVQNAYARPSRPSFEATVPNKDHALPMGPIEPWRVRSATTAEALVQPGRPVVQVPILMYHYIRNNPDPKDKLGFNLSVTPSDFQAQMDWLSDHGWHPITLTQMRAYYDGGTLPAKPIVLTFDDGYLDFYTTALPILQQHHFTAVAYIVSGFIGMPARYMTSDQLVELDRYGIEIGAHTVTHPNLTKLSTESLRHEVHDSKLTLEAIVGHPVLDFCYPAGNFDGRVSQMVTDQGFLSATTTKEGVGHASRDRYTWSRTRVSGGESLDDFAKQIAVHEDGIQPALPSIVLPRVYPLLYVRMA